MKVLIKTQILGKGGNVEWREELLSTEQIDIGRATNQTIQIYDNRVALQHATILPMTGGAQLKVNASGNVLLNGSITRQSALRQGDVVQIGHATIEMRGKQDGIDLVLLVDLTNARTAVASKTEYRMGLNATRFSMRLWSWASFVGLISLLLIFPLQKIVSRGDTEIDRAAMLVSDHAWQSGPMHKAHQSIGDNCNVCHQTPFAVVQNEACTSCHDNMAVHFDGAMFPAVALQSPGTMRCANCHHEHNEMPSMARHDASLCSNCHRDLNAIGGEGSLSPPVTQFHLDHPVFSASMLAPAQQADKWQWTITRSSLSLLQGQDKNHLIFPHDVHLKFDGVKAPAGKEKLDCGNCHQPDATGNLMQPINMETHCSRCHVLEFEPGYPDRLLPHGNEKALMATLQEFYARQWLEGELNRLNALGRDARRPGGEWRQSLIEQRQEGLAYAKEKAFATADDLFTRRTCITCHQIEKRTGAELPWRVKPVKLTQQWFPKARFDHAAHRGSECSLCHDAGKSKNVSDVLLPDVEVCQSCHVGEFEKHGVPSTCVDCHRFHQFDSTVMK